MIQSLVHYYKAHKQRLHRLTRESTWIVIGQITSVAGALVLVRVLTEYLSPSEFGQLALGLTIASLVNQIVMGGLVASICRFYSIAIVKQDLGGYFYSVLFLLLCATGMVLVIGAAITAGLNWLGYSEWISLTLAALLFAIFSGYSSALIGIQNAARQRAVTALYGGLEAWLKILLALSIVLWVGTSSTALIIGYACLSMAITVLQLIFLRRIIPRQQTQIQKPLNWAPQIWTYSLPFVAFGGFTWLQQVSDRWALQLFASISEVGEYAVLFQLGFMPITLIVGMASNFFAPILYQRSGDATDFIRSDNVHRIVWRITQVAIIFTLIGFVVTFAFHEWLFSILVASEYRGISYLLPWILTAGGIFAAGQILSLKLMSEMRQSKMTIVKITTALIGALLNIIGAVLFGLQGVVWAVLFFSGIYFIWMAMLTSRLPSLCVKV